MRSCALARPGLLQLSNLAGPLQHFKTAILDAWRDKVSIDLCGRKGFRAGLCWMSMAPCSSLILLMFEREIRLCFVAPWLEVSGTVFFLVGFETRFYLVGFVGSSSLLVIDISFVPQRQIPMVQAFPQTTETPQLLFDFRWSMPCCAFRAGSLPRRGAEVVSYGPDCSSDHRDFAVAVRVGSSMSLLCWSCSLLVVSWRSENCGSHSCSSCLVVDIPLLRTTGLGGVAGAVPARCGRRCGAAATSSSCRS